MEGMLQTLVRLASFVLFSSYFANLEKNKREGKEKNKREGKEKNKREGKEKNKREGKKRTKRLREVGIAHMKTCDEAKNRRV